MRRRSMWAIRLFPWGLTAVSLLLQPGLNAGAAIANVAADAVAPRAFTAMAPAVESVNRNPQHRREISDRHQSLLSNLVHNLLPSGWRNRHHEWCAADCYACRLP